MKQPTRPTYAWWIVLSLVGLDYFSSLAYLPSIAITYAANVRDLAPVAGVGVVLVTLLAALPVYWYVVGRSPNGRGGIGLLSHVTHGWGGKLLVLALLGFVATDFILTRTLSVSDAATHLIRNNYYEEWAPTRASLAQHFPGGWGRWLVDHLNEQLVLTLLLSVLAFTSYHFLIQTLSKGFVGLATSVVLLYLIVNAVVIASGVVYIFEHPTLLGDWKARLLLQLGERKLESGGALGLALLLGLKAFPPMAIGLSGFELTMASAPSVKGSPTDTPEHPTGRIWRTRLLMVVVALVMSVLVLGSSLVAALLIDPQALWNPEAEAYEHRALSYLAHGGMMADQALATRMNSLFGAPFGTLYDLSTILILCLAGAGATLSMKDIVPDLLSRFGMQLSWAHRIGVITHLFNGVILLVTVAFKASVAAQLWAYATAVIALLFGASFAAYLDLKQRWTGSLLRFYVGLPFLLIALLFLAMGVLIVYQQPVGVAIALLFVGVTLATAITSRWLRATEMRFDGFEFHDASTATRWEEICKLEYQALVPHDPTSGTLSMKDHEVRQRHRIDDEVSIIFIEVEVGDPSDFFQKPMLQIVKEENREVIRVRRATSVAHVIAAIGLAFREVGSPPEFYFKWSGLHPMEATVNFLLLGQGNIPMLVRTLIHRAEPDPTRRPRVVLADG
ncbi:MAG: amino acid transporter [Gemmataceae bacterium]